MTCKKNINVLHQVLEEANYKQGYDVTYGYKYRQVTNSLHHHNQISGGDQNFWGCAESMPKCTKAALTPCTKTQNNTKDTLSSFYFSLI